MSNFFSLKPITRAVCGFAAVGALTLSLAGCGDTFRPIVIPNPTPGVDPGAQRTAMVLTQSPAPPAPTGTCAGALAPPCPGTMMQINVSGDTNSSGFTSPGDLANYVVGRAPMRGSFGVAFPQQFYMVNQDSDSVTIVTPSTGTEINVTLPQGSGPTFLAVTGDPNGTTGNDLVLTANTAANTVTFVDAAQRTARLTAPVGTHPVAIAGIPSLRKAYVVNEQDNSVSVISTVDGTSVHDPIPVGTDPVAIVVNNGASVAYVINRGSGNVSVIDTAQDAVSTTITTGAGASFGVFDPKLLRVYVVNSGANSVTVIDASGIGIAPRTVTLPAGASNPVGVTALADGSRFYTVNFDTNNVTVFDAQSFTAKTNIPVGTHPVFIAAASDSSRVYVANHDATLDAGGNQTAPPGTTIIRAIAAPTDNPPKAADTVVTTIPATFNNPQGCTQESATCVREQPVFIAVQ